MELREQFYIGGRWTAPHSTTRLDVIDPATETAFARIALGNGDDLDRAVRAARSAFESWSRTAVTERKAVLDRIIAGYTERSEEIAHAIMREMGAPWSLAKSAQVAAGLRHFRTVAGLLESFPWEESRGRALIVREPIGVCGLITPWNWPINQVAAKVAPALGAGCTVILKPSEIAPLDAMILAEVIAETDLPPGVFNLVNGDGPNLGAAMSRHRDIDMVSFTGSTRAGIDVAIGGAPTVKRITQELGGKSANILLEDADVRRSVRAGVLAVMANTGQSCNAPTRMLVPASRLADAEAVAVEALARVRVGAPDAAGTTMGPQASQAQWERVQAHIDAGLAEGAKLLAGGPGRPEGLERGYFTRPTIFSDVRNQMTIAREEIFGPVLAILPYQNEDEAVAIANDSDYGLSGYVTSADSDRALAVARRLRTGGVHLNGAPLEPLAPFGGYRRSGNGREWGAWGLEEYLETKSIYGAGLS
ncbi:MAG: aldehyde dehydrogenase family protein [Pseudomonadota bacterium]